MYKHTLQRCLLLLPLFVTAACEKNLDLSPSPYDKQETTQKSLTQPKTAPESKISTVDDSSGTDKELDKKELARLKQELGVSDFENEWGHLKKSGALQQLQKSLADFLEKKKRKRSLWSSLKKLSRKKDSPWSSFRNNSNACKGAIGALRTFLALDSVGLNDDKKAKMEAIEELYREADDKSFDSYLRYQMAIKQIDSYREDLLQAANYLLKASSAAPKFNLQKFKQLLESLTAIQKDYLLASHAQTS